MKKFTSNPKFKNPYLWLSVVALIFSAGGVNFETLTSWQLLGQALMDIIQNPVSVVAVITALLGIYNDNSTPGLDKVEINEERGE